MVHRALEQTFSKESAQSPLTTKRSKCRAGSFSRSDQIGRSSRTLMMSALARMIATASSNVFGMPCSPRFALNSRRRFAHWSRTGLSLAEYLSERIAKEGLAWWRLVDDLTRKFVGDLEKLLTEVGIRALDLELREMKHVPAHHPDELRDGHDSRLLNTQNRLRLLTQSRRQPHFEEA